MWQPLRATQTELHRYLKQLAPFLSAALETQYASDPAKCLSLYMYPSPILISFPLVKFAPPLPPAALQEEGK